MTLSKAFIHLLSHRCSNEHCSSKGKGSCLGINLQSSICPCCQVAISDFPKKERKEGNPDCKALGKEFMMKKWVELVPIKI